MMTQSDHLERVVSLENLRAMCDRVSGIARDRFAIERVTRNRVYVTVAYPDGMDGAVTAAFPAYPSPWDGVRNPYVVLDIVRIIGADQNDYDPSQYFLPLLECPRLFRGPGGEWQTEEEALAESESRTAVLQCAVCGAKRHEVDELFIRPSDGWTRCGRCYDLEQENRQ